MKKIVTFTVNPAIDKSSSVEHVISDSKLNCNKPSYEPGGGGVNVSRAIKKLGGESTLLYTSGGITGQRLDNLLEKESLNKKSIPIKESTRENLTILETTTNLQYRFGMPGPVLSRKEVETCFEKLNKIDPLPDYLVLSGSLSKGIPNNLYAKIIKKAKKKEIKVIVDTAGEPLKKVLQEGTFLIKPNIGEFKKLLDKKLNKEAEIKKEALQLVKDNCCAVIVISLGASGVLWATRDIVKIMRPPIVPIKSKVGAGDSMVAGIVLSLARGNSTENSVLFGLAAGSAAVMTPGSELCREEDTESLYEKILAG